MDKEQALWILKCEDEETAIQEAHEQVLFDEKQFFFTRTPIKAVFEKRLQKVKRAEEAFETLTQGSIDNFAVQVPPFSGQKKLDSVLNHQSIIKNAILTASSFKSLAPLVNQLIESEQLYNEIVFAQLAPIAKNENWEKQTIGIMQKVDIMELKEGLTYLENHNSTIGLEKHLTEVMIKEYSRLSKT